MARQFSVGDVELKEAMAGGEPHLIDPRDVPGAHDQSAAVGLGLDIFDDPGNLVDAPAVRRVPAPPLGSVHRPELSLFVGPFIPDRYPAIAEVFDIGAAHQEPEQLMDDAL